MKLKPIAEKVFNRCVTGSWQPKRRDIEKRYKLTESQLRVVIKYTKEIAGDLGVIWGYDPEVNYFRVAPGNTPEIAKRMLQYQIRHWKDAGKSTTYLFKGAQKQGYVGKRDAQFVADLDKLFEARLKMIEKKVKSL